MKLYPYTNIQTKNLKPLLLSARVLGLLSYVLFFFALFIGIYGVLIDQPKAFDVAGFQGTMSAPGTTGPALIGAIWGLVSSVCVLAFSGLCAAVVSCEHKFTSS